MSPRPAAAKSDRSKGGKRPPVKLAPGVAARVAAITAVHAVFAEHRPADSVLDDPHGPFASLDPRERALARAILGIALRRHGQIIDALGRFLEKSLPRKSGHLAAILHVAAAQILFMDVADHAAVSIAVDLASQDHDARHFKGLVNAVLRRLTEGRDAILASQDEAVLNTPDWLAAGWTKAYGADTARAIAIAHLAEPALDLTVRSDPALWAEKLEGIVLPNDTVRLVGHRSIEAMPGFEEGAWWVQDAAAALPARLLGAVECKAVADLCAAPGGKTLQLAARGARVTAVDISVDRLHRVRQNLDRIGLDAELVAADLLDWQPGRIFDAVLLDAPCSSTGTIRRHPDVALLKRPADIASLAKLQAELIARAVDLLEPGGVLVYSTCSLEPAEGEIQVQRALARLPLRLVPIEPSEIGGLSELCRSGQLRSLPTDLPAAEPRMGGLDGFFAARFVKT
ncbi:MAG TPA: transcription antitermination factor NusB [Kaistia sp.]|nr:transcription antitermination factor NusB [Kaistia sp.]